MLCYYLRGASFYWWRFAVFLILILILIPNLMFCQCDVAPGSGGTRADVTLS